MHIKNYRQFYIKTHWKCVVKLVKCTLSRKFTLCHRKPTGRNAAGIFLSIDKYPFQQTKYPSFGERRKKAIVADDGFELVTPPLWVEHVSTRL